VQKRSVSCRCSNTTNAGLYPQITVNVLNIKFDENPFSRSLFCYKEADMANLTGASQEPSLRTRHEPIIPGLPADKLIRFGLHVT
jgi:hypothetical protein